jgi:hypothetical protein
MAAVWAERVRDIGHRTSDIGLITERMPNRENSLISSREWLPYSAASRRSYVALHGAQRQL